MMVVGNHAGLTLIRPTERIFFSYKVVSGTRDDIFQSKEKVAKVYICTADSSFVSFPLLKTDIF